MCPGYKDGRIDEYTLQSVPVFNGKTMSPPIGCFSELIWCLTDAVRNLVFGHCQYFHGQDFDMINWRLRRTNIQCSIFYSDFALRHFSKKLYQARDTGIIINIFFQPSIFLSFTTVLSIISHFPLTHLSSHPFSLSNHLFPTYPSIHRSTIYFSISLSQYNILVTPLFQEFITRCTEPWIYVSHVIFSLNSHATNRPYHTASNTTSISSLPSK